MKTVILKNFQDDIPVGKIVCVGRNYADHAKELGNEVPKFPIIFFKPNSAIIYSDGKVIHPTFSQDLQHEVELVLLIGKNVKNATLEESENAISAYAIGLDMTLRDIQKEASKKGEPWTVAKGFDTSAVLSEFISKEDYQLTSQEEMWLKVNGEVRQKTKLENMIFNPAELVKNISSMMSLQKGDLIFTGTPAGVSRVFPGDKIEAEIENIASLNCTIEKE